MNNNVTNTTAKRKRKFNIIDFFIVLIALMLIAVLVYAISPLSQLKKLFNHEDVKLEYVVEIKGVGKDFCDLINKKDSVINNVTKNSLGVVSSIDKIDASTTLSYQIDENNNISGVLVEEQQKYDITVRISAEADYQEGVGYTVNGCRIAIGEEIFLRFPQFASSGYCVAIDPQS